MWSNRIMPQTSTSWCNHTNSNPDLNVPITLNPTFHEVLTGATAEYVDKSNTQGEAPPVVTTVDPSGVAHQQLSQPAARIGIFQFVGAKPIDSIHLGIVPPPILQIP